jgi:hypothetical protein
MRLRFGKQVEAPERPPVKGPHLVMDRRILDRVYQDCMSFPSVEVGGRWVGFHFPPDEMARLRRLFPKVESTGGAVYVIIDYIPMGPNPQSQSAVELQPDRQYQMWAYRRMQRINPDIDVLGSWHSHIPNGLERFSRGDHESYHSKLNTPAAPYPLESMLCSLIHRNPRGPKDMEQLLRHAWFPRNAEVGTHNWVKGPEIQWISDSVPREFSRLIDPTDYSPYLRRGRVSDWFEGLVQLIGEHPFPPGTNPSIDMHPEKDEWLLTHENGGIKVQAVMKSRGGVSIRVSTPSSVLKESNYEDAVSGLSELSDVLEHLGFNTPRYDLVTPMVAEAYEEIIELEKKMDNERAILEQQQAIVKQQQVNIESQKIRIASHETELNKAQGRLGQMVGQRKIWERTTMVALDNLGSDLPRHFAPGVLTLLLKEKITTLSQMRELGREGLEKLGMPQRVINDVIERPVPTSKITPPPPPPLPKKALPMAESDHPTSRGSSPQSTHESLEVTEDQDSQE